MQYPTSNRHHQEEQKRLRIDESMLQLDHLPGINSSAQNSDLDEANINVEIEQGRGNGG